MIWMALLGLVTSCDPNQENAVLDVFYPRTLLGYEDVYRINPLNQMVEEILYNQPVYLDGEGKVEYIEIDGFRMGLSEVSYPFSPLDYESVTLKYRADKYYVERIPSKQK